MAGWNARASTPSHGDGFLYLGDSGYAYLENDNVTDLDYSRGFSVEAVVRIEPHQPGGRWATFIEKGGDLVLRQVSSAGFGIGTLEGNSRDFGQYILAKIGDGTNQVVLESPRAYQGYVHAVTTWNVAAKTMTLYINGQWIDSKSNPLISPALIRNNGELRLGKGYCELRRNVFLARLWNRELSAWDVARLWSALAQSWRHALPEMFDRSGLLSEWLMERMASPQESARRMRLRDSVGPNHLKLAGQARLVSGEEPMTGVYPADGAVEVNPSVVLQVRGGRAELGQFLAAPLHYSFEVDESATFCSSALRQSGWIAHYGQWKPVLKPSTQYYWRCKVRDSGTPPKESLFSRGYQLKTRSPATWYVRPLVDRDATVDDLGNPVADRRAYGKQDGTSYAHAFNGIAHIRWGESGVAAGDTLYVCDTHVYQDAHSYWAPPAVGYIEESGSSAEYPITIAMDCPEHEGVLCGFFRDVQSDARWTGPDEHGVYRTSDLRCGATVEARGGDYLWLDRASDTTWDGHFGSVCNIPRVDEPWLVEATYIKMSDGGNPAGRVYSPDWGFRFDLGRSSYVRFQQCSFFNSMVVADSIEHTNGELPPSRSIVFENCKLGYRSDTLMDLSDGMDSWVFRGCEIHHVGKGIHASSVYDLLIEQCAIHDIGAPSFPDKDAHAIGIQNGANHVIQRNHIWNTAGSAIEFWSSRLPMQNMVVCFNFIHDTLGLAQTSASGIVISGEECAPGNRTGFRVYNNIVMNTAGGDEPWRGFGISSNSMDPVEIYNNVLYRTYHGIRLVTSSPEPGYPVRARVYNNMIVEPRGDYAFVYGSSEPWSEFYWDHNLYYPATDFAARFSFGQEVRRDSYSLLADPQFVAAQPLGPADFELQPDSQAIDAGADVGLVEDYAGRPVPQGAAPDIGVFEYP